MFERYNEKARRVVFFARYEASQFGASQIEPEHILLGLIREDRDLRARFLPDYSPVFNRIRESIEAHEVPKHIRGDVDLPLSNEAKRVLSFAAQESEMLGNRYIGTEHLLLGLLAEKGTKAYEILTELGLRLDDVRKAIKDEDPSKVRSIIDRFIQNRLDQPDTGEHVRSARGYCFEEESWSPEVLKTCLDLGLITNSELAQELTSVSVMRNFAPDVEALLRLLVAKGLVDPQNLVLLALELRDEEKLLEFLEKLKDESAQS
jgi:ATP-dependent Clp protease ATP-binding subunit ClpA